ncbi:hypothetical protein J5N97_028406 [Dioscorea zingiberensis]|uniref:Serine acetyltransferase N-terminal domain-containing protein n=1 Tax=Dioscorea zingiberensis TaxID=325984 RepID=A0A9D5BZ66_9LILI|nr:hypothetical protein J5N97_028406 [Dioscorea zingiberensis]
MEPVLRKFYEDAILSHGLLEATLAGHLAKKLGSGSNGLGSDVLTEKCVFSRIRSTASIPLDPRELSPSGEDRGWSAAGSRDWAGDRGDDCGGEPRVNPTLCDAGGTGKIGDRVLVGAETQILGA